MQIFKNRLARLVACGLLVLSPLFSVAAEVAPDTAASQPLTAELAPAQTLEAAAVVFNRQIAVFRAPLFGISPRDRARRTESGIRELLAKNGPGEVTQQPIAQGITILLDGSLAVVLIPADADPLTRESLSTVAETTAAALRRVVEETRESRNFKSLLRSLAIAAAATAALGVLLWLLGRLRYRITNRLIRVADSHADQLALAGTQLIRRERLLELIRISFKLLYWSLAALLLYEWLSLVFAQFPYTRPWGERLNLYLLEFAERILGGIVRTVPNLVIALAICLLARWIVGFQKAFFNRVEQGQIQVPWLDPDTVAPTRRLAAGAVWLFALAMAYPYLPGAQTEAFKGLSVLIGLMVSIGASSLVGQAASGLILIYTHTLKVGEFVKIADIEGTVTTMGMFSTRIHTGLGEEVTLSNSMILGSITRNYSRAVAGPGFIVETAVTIGYDAPWRQVEAMLLEAARRTPSVLGKPAPQVFQTSLSDFYVEYRLVCQAIPTEAQARAEVLNRLLANIQDVFNEYGVQIMSPHYFADPNTAKVVPPDHWRPAPAKPQEPPREGVD